MDSTKNSNSSTGKLEEVSGTVKEFFRGAGDHLQDQKF